eukprot:COSAG02_NODE_3069_length_7427_cov_7.977211_8_plen_83_part_00
MSSMFTLSFGMVPAANQESNWKTVADWVSVTIAQLLSFASQQTLAWSQLTTSSDRVILTVMCSHCASDRVSNKLVITGHSGS